MGGSNQKSAILSKVGTRARDDQGCGGGGVPAGGGCAAAFSAGLW